MEVIKDDYICKIEVVKILQKAYAEGRIKAKDGCSSMLDDINALSAADVEPVDRWIDAQKNPPPIVDKRSMSSESVLILRSNGRYAVAYYCYDTEYGNYWTTDDDKTMYDWRKVAYWQPLPKSPKDGEAE